MSQHLCEGFDPACWRCDLSRDEVTKMARKLRREEVLDTIIDALNDCNIYGVDAADEVRIAEQVLGALEDEGVIDDREVE